MMLKPRFLFEQELVIRICCKLIPFSVVILFSLPPSSRVRTENLNFEGQHFCEQYFGVREYRLNATLQGEGEVPSLDDRKTQFPNIS